MKREQYRDPNSAPPCPLHTHTSHSRASRDAGGTREVRNLGCVWGGSSSVLESARSIPVNYHILELLPKNLLRQTLIFYQESVAKCRVSKALWAPLKEGRTRIQSEFVLWPGKECGFQYGVPRHFLPPIIWGTWNQTPNLTEPVSSSLKIEWESSNWLGRIKTHNSGPRPLSPQKCSYGSGCVVDEEEGGDRVRQSLHSSLILKLQQVGPGTLEIWIRSIQNWGSRWPWTHSAKRPIPNTREPSSINTQWSCCWDTHQWAKNTLRKHNRWSISPAPASGPWTTGTVTLQCLQPISYAPCQDPNRKARRQSSICSLWWSSSCNSWLVAD